PRRRGCSASASARCATSWPSIASGVNCRPGCRPKAEETMPNILFDPTIEGLARTLTLHQQRHAVLASNLANVETPGYRARELDFQDALKQAFEETGAGSGGERTDGHRTITLASPDRTPQVVEDKTAPRRAD